MMVMAKEMAVAMPKAMSETVAVAVAVSEAVTMAVAVTMAAGESLARDRQGSRGKRKSADGGRDDLLDANHGESPWSAARGSLCLAATLEATIAL
jgi:hypothetical protein